MGEADAASGVPTMGAATFDKAVGTGASQAKALSLRNRYEQEAMGYEDFKRAIEEAVAGPLHELRSEIASLNQYHNQALYQLTDNINDLLYGTDGEPAMMGQAAQALSDTVANYVNVASAVSGYGTDVDGIALDGYTLPAVKQSETTSNILYDYLENLDGPRQVAFIKGNYVPSQQVQVDSAPTVDPAGAFVGAVDVGAVAQGGLDVPWDIVAGIATGIYGLYKLSQLFDDPDMDKIKQASVVVKAILDDWQKKVQADTGMLKPLPMNPTDDKNFTSTLGNVQNLLTDEQAGMAKRLASQYGVPLSVVEDIISKNPGLSEEEYRLLIQYYQKYKIVPYGAVKVFTMVNSKGKTVIVYVTQAAINHIRSGHPSLDPVSNEELANLVEQLLQEEPDWTETRDNNGLKSTVYYYSDVEIDGKYYTIGIVISTTTPGRIITINTNQEN